MHSPVLLQNVIKSLDTKAGGLYIDATVGEGGHLEAKLKKKRKKILKKKKKKKKINNIYFQLIYIFI